MLPLRYVFYKTNITNKTYILHNNRNKQRKQANKKKKKKQLKLGKKKLEDFTIVELRYQTFMLDGLHYKINNGGNITRRSKA